MYTFNLRKKQMFVNNFSPLSLLLNELFLRYNNKREIQITMDFEKKSEFEKHFIKGDIGSISFLVEHVHTDSHWITVS